MANTLRKRYLPGAYEDFCFKSHSSDPPLIYSHVQWAEDNNSSYKQKTAKMAARLTRGNKSCSRESKQYTQSQVSRFYKFCHIEYISKDCSYTESLCLEMVVLRIKKKEKKQKETKCHIKIIPMFPLLLCSLFLIHSNLYLPLSCT